MLIGVSSSPVKVENILPKFGRARAADGGGGVEFYFNLILSVEPMEISRAPNCGRDCSLSGNLFGRRFVLVDICFRCARGKKRKLMIHFFALASFGFFWKFFSDLPVVMVMGPSQVNGFPVRYGLCNLLKFKSAKFNENIFFKK